jgi:hypothetical protein
MNNDRYKMTLIVFWILLVLILSMCSCDRMTEFKNESEVKAFSMNSPNESLDTLKMRVYKFGDVNAYLKLEYYFYDISMPQDLLPYSLILSNKFNNSIGAIGVYHCLIGPFLYDGIEDIDSVTSNIAIEYLLKAAYLKNESAIFLVKKYNIKFIPKLNRSQIINMNSLRKKGNLKKAI